MNPPPLRVLLIDDHQLFRQGLRMLFERSPGITVVGEAGNAIQALQISAKVEPDVIVADVHLPDGNGIELAVQVRANCPNAKIIFLSSDSEIAMVRRALQVGGSGYLLKDSAPAELMMAVHAAAKGGVSLSPEIAAALVQDYGLAPKTKPAAPAPETMLSEREAAVLKFITDGLRNKEMAERLQVSVKSIETYRRRLLQKLNCSSTVELIRKAIREGLIPS